MVSLGPADVGKDRDSLIRNPQCTKIAPKLADTIDIHLRGVGRTEGAERSHPWNLWGSRRINPAAPIPCYASPKIEKSSRAHGPHVVDAPAICIAKGNKSIRDFGL